MLTFVIEWGTMVPALENAALCTIGGSTRTSGDAFHGCCVR